MIGLLFQVILVLVVAGFLAWVVRKLPFIDASLAQIVQGVILFLALIFLIYTCWAFFEGGTPIIAKPHR